MREVLENYYIDWFVPPSHAAPQSQGPARHITFVPHQKNWGTLSAMKSGSLERNVTPAYAIFQIMEADEKKFLGLLNKTTDTEDWLPSCIICDLPGGQSSTTILEIQKFNPQKGDETLTIRLDPFFDQGEKLDVWVAFSDLGQSQVQLERLSLEVADLEDLLKGKSTKLGKDASVNCVWYRYEKVANDGLTLSPVHFEKLEPMNFEISLTFDKVNKVQTIENEPYSPAGWEIKLEIPCYHLSVISLNDRIKLVAHQLSSVWFAQANPHKAGKVFVGEGYPAFLNLPGKAGTHIQDDQILKRPIVQFIPEVYKAMEVLLVSFWNAARLPVPVRYRSLSQPQETQLSQTKKRYQEFKEKWGDSSVTLFTEAAQKAHEAIRPALKAKEKSENVQYFLTAEAISTFIYLIRHDKAFLFYLQRSLKNCANSDKRNMAVPYPNGLLVPLMPRKFLEQDMFAIWDEVLDNEARHSNMPVLKNVFTLNKSMSERAIKNNLIGEPLRTDNALIFTYGNGAQQVPMQGEFAENRNPIGQLHKYFNEMANLDTVDIYANTGLSFPPLEGIWQWLQDNIEGRPALDEHLFEMFFKVFHHHMRKQLGNSKPGFDPLTAEDIMKADLSYSDEVFNIIRNNTSQTSERDRFQYLLNRLGGTAISLDRFDDEELPILYSRHSAWQGGDLQVFMSVLQKMNWDQTNPLRPEILRCKEFEDLDKAATGF